MFPWSKIEHVIFDIDASVEDPNTTDYMDSDLEYNSTCSEDEDESNDVPLNYVGCFQTFNQHSVTRRFMFD